MTQQTVGRNKAQIASHTNLIQSLTSFIGRKKELVEVHQLLTQARLLTLTGVGGCGKTRLARHVAAELAAKRSLEDGVWFVEFAALNDPNLVPQEVAQTLGIREVFDQPAISLLVDHLEEKHLLLIFDNCEHLLAACAELAEKLLLASSGLQILATSREPLGVPGETTFLVPSLSLPEQRHWLPSSELAEYDAPALFVERARSVLPAFTLTEQNTSAILQVCRRLDGIPLAIELAAARVNVLTVEQIAARLDDRFNLLTSSNRAAVLPRHQTLQATIDWSYDLLTEKERILFRRLAVFVGGFTLEAAEAVCAGDGIEQSEILDGLARLVSKSLIVAEILEQRQARYHLLETIRQYAFHRLRESGEENKVCGHHCDWFLALAEESRARWRGPSQKEVFNQLETEHDNLRAALEWTKLEITSSERALRLGGALWRFWQIHDHLREGRQHLAQILSLLQTQAHTAARARALYGAGYLALMQGDYRSSQEYFEENLAMARELNDPQLIANAMYGLGILARYLGDHQRAVERLEESLVLFRQLGDRVGEYISLFNLAEAATARGEYQQAETLHEASLALKRAQGDEWSIANSLICLATLARLQGKNDRAINLIKDGLELFRKIGDRSNIANSLLEFSAIALTQGHSQVGIQLHAAAATLLEALGYSSDDLYRAQSELPLRMIRAKIGAARFIAAWEKGRALTMDQAIEQALGLSSLLDPQVDLAISGKRGEEDQSLLAPLNERELEVLRLIADGLSNREIAARLVIALSTVKWHINNLFSKLSVRSRTQAVAQAKKLGLL